MGFLPASYPLWSTQNPRNKTSLSPFIQGALGLTLGAGWRVHILLISHIKDNVLFQRKRHRVKETFKTAEE